MSRVSGPGFGVQSSEVCVLEGGVGMVMVKRGGGGHQPPQFSVPAQINWFQPKSIDFKEWGVFKDCYKQIGKRRTRDEVCFLVRIPLLVLIDLVRSRGLVNRRTRDDFFFGSNSPAGID